MAAYRGWRGDPLAGSGRGYQCRKSKPGKAFRGEPEILPEVDGSASKSNLKTVTPEVKISGVFIHVVLQTGTAPGLVSTCA